MTTMRSKRSKTEWPPPWARLPDDLDKIEHGPLVQRELFDTPADESRETRLRRLFGSGRQKKRLGCLPATKRKNKTVEG